MAGVCFKRYRCGWTCWICWMEICCVQRGVPGHEIGEERWHVWIAKTFPLFLWNLPNLGERHRRRKVSNWPVSTWSNVHHTGRIFGGFHLCWGGGWGVELSPFSTGEIVEIFTRVDWEVHHLSTQNYILDAERWHRPKRDIIKEWGKSDFLCPFLPPFILFSSLCAPTNFLFFR